MILLIYFIRLRFCVNRSVPVYLLEHYYYSAVTPHALRARVVSVYILYTCTGRSTYNT